jgi:hypothetical protein
MDRHLQKFRGAEDQQSRDVLTPARFVPDEESNLVRRAVAAIMACLVVASLISYFGLAMTSPWLWALPVAYVAARAGHLVYLIMFIVMLAPIRVGPRFRNISLAIFALIILLPFASLLLLVTPAQAAAVVPVTILIWSVGDYGPGVVEGSRPRLVTSSLVVLCACISLTPVVARLHGVAVNVYVWALFLSYIAGAGTRLTARPWIGCALDRSLVALPTALRRATLSASRNAALAVVAVGVASALALGTAHWPTDILVTALFALVVGLATGWAWLLAIASFDRASRGRYRRGQFADRVVLFLEWAATKGFLVRIGSAYRWSHDELALYFARSHPGRANVEQLLAVDASCLDSYSRGVALLDIDFYLSEHIREGDPTTRSRLEAKRQELLRLLVQSGEGSSTVVGGNAT